MTAVDGRAVRARPAGQAVRDDAAGPAPVPAAGPVPQQAPAAMGGSRAGVITGIGLITPVGTGLAEVFAGLCAGQPGLRRPPEGHPLAGVTDAAGIAPDLDPATVVSPTEARIVDRYIVMALVAADHALAEAGIVVGRDVDPYRVAVIVSCSGGLATMESQVLARAERGRRGVSPYMLPAMLPNMASARIAIRHGIQGYSSSIATACAAGAQSIGEGLRLLRAGEADVVVCGSSEAQLFPTLADAFGNAWALARGWPDPATACRPFDSRRCGFVLSEGAGVLVLERPEFARARGAAGYADLIGWGVTTDAHHPTTPRPDGSAAAECMRRALADAGISGSDVGYLNAHGTGTKLGDVAEAAAIHAVFRDGPPVSSVKGSTGHMLGASGALEAAVTAAALARGLLPPTRNLDDPDPACELDHVLGGPREATLSHAMSNTFAFGGHNISLVFGHPSATPARELAGQVEGA
jgi:3-oxoacyl-[acyl-carrier-protein] synthase II